MTDVKKANNDAVTIVELASGKNFLGVLTNGVIKNAMEISPKPLVGFFGDYLIERELGNLAPRKLSAVADFTEVPLTPVQKAEWNYIVGLFEMAKEQAPALAVVNCFDQLYRKK